MPRKKTTTRNRFKVILSLKIKDAGNYTPTPELLAKLRMDKRRFKHLMNNVVFAHPTELPLFAEWLECTEEELLEPITDLFEEKAA